MRQVGLLLAKGGVLRASMEVITEDGSGITTSGVFSPTLNQSIAIARVLPALQVSMPKLSCGKEMDVRVLKLPFVRHGKKQFD